MQTKRSEAKSQMQRHVLNRYKNRNGNESFQDQLERGMNDRLKERGWAERGSPICDR